MNYSKNLNIWPNKISLKDLNTNCECRKTHIKTWKASQKTQKVFTNNRNATFWPAAKSGQINPSVFLPRAVAKKKPLKFFCNQNRISLFTFDRNLFTCLMVAQNLPNAWLRCFHLQNWLFDFCWIPLHWHGGQRIFLAHGVTASLRPPRPRDYAESLKILVLKEILHWFQNYWAQGSSNLGVLSGCSRRAAAFS